MKALVGLGALLALCYAMADKNALPAMRREMNRKAWPWCAAIVVGVLFLFFGYPLLVR